MYSAEPIRPNSSAPQLPKIIDLRGLHLPDTEENSDLFIGFGLSGMIHWSVGTFLTLFDHRAQHPRHFQHDGGPAARVDGAVDPTVPVVSVNDVPVCEAHQIDQQLSKINSAQFPAFYPGLTWLDTPPDDAHHVGGVLHLHMVEDFQLNITGIENVNRNPIGFSDVTQHQQPFT